MAAAEAETQALVPRGPFSESRRPGAVRGRRFGEHRCSGSEPVAALGSETRREYRHTLPAETQGPAVAGLRGCGTGVFHGKRVSSRRAMKTVARHGGNAGSSRRVRRLFRPPAMEGCQPVCADTVGAMRTLKAFPRTACAGLVAAGCAASLLVGCSSGDEAGQGPGTETTVTDTVTQPPSTAPAQPESTSSHPSAPGEDAADDSCSDAPVSNSLTGDQPIPVHFANADNAEASFYYSVEEGQPDPCTPLSWVKLAGSNGTDGPGATAGSTRETVALFGDGQLITDPAPILARRIDSIEQVDDRTVRVNYAFYTEAPAAEDETESGSATFHWTGDQVEVSENTLPVSQNEEAETLDMSGIM